MGYTSIFTYKDFSEVFKEEVVRGFEVLEVAEVKGTPVGEEKESSVFYAAIRPEGKSYVIGLVVIMKSFFEEKKREVIWKEMDESSGPFYYDCPESILDKLSPIEKIEYPGEAANWRKQCLLVSKGKSSKI